MTSFKEEGHHSILELLYNRKHKWGRLVVENVFGILKKTFRKLQKFELHVTFLLDMFTCYCMLHNLLRYEDEANIVRQLWIIELEVGVNENWHHGVVDEAMNQARSKGQEKFGNVLWKELTLYLDIKRNFQWITSKYVLLTLCQIINVIKNVDFFFFRCISIHTTFCHVSSYHPIIFFI
jgi:hypothetical protein